MERQKVCLAEETYCCSALVDVRSAGMALQRHTTLSFSTIVHSEVVYG